MKRIFGSLLFVVVMSGFRCAGADEPTITQQPVSQIVTNGGTAAFTVAVSGTGPFSYQWQLNGTNLTPFITTVAGNGSYGYWNDGGQATNARLASPSGVAVNRAGELVIVDTRNYRIRKVDTNGIFSTVAGNGSSTPVDGGLATNSGIYIPDSVAFDSLGNLFISDTALWCVRKVDTNGFISTVAGVLFGGAPGDGGLAINAKMPSPKGLAVDAAGNLFILAGGIRKVDTNGIITSVASNTLGVTLPQDIAVDRMGNLYVADPYNNRIRRVDTNGVVTTIAGTGISGYSGNGGLATNAMLSSPMGVAVDDLGNLFIADSGNKVIRKVDANGIITTVAGNGNSSYSGDGGPAISAGLPCSDITSDGFDNLYVVDSSGNRVRKINHVSAMSPVLALGNPGPANVGDYSVIISNAYGSVTSQVASLNVLIPPSITSQATNQVVSVGANATFSVSVSGDAPLSYFWLRNGSPIAGANGSSYTINGVQLSDSGAQFSCLVSNGCGSVTSRVAMLDVGTPPEIARQPANETVTNGSAAFLTVEVSGAGPIAYQWQLNGTNVSPTIITVAGGGTTSLGAGGPATRAALTYPFGLALDGTGNLLFSENGAQRIRKLDTNGIITTVAGNGTNGYSGDGGVATNASINHPEGIALDRTGNLYLADYLNNRVRKVDPNGVVTTVAGNGTNGYLGDGGPAISAQLYSPSGIAFDRVGNLLIADYINSRIRKVDGNGVITTVAGNGFPSYLGDGGPATLAEIDDPSGVALDGADNLLIVDFGNNRIRKVDSNGIITTIAGNGAWGFSGDGGLATSAGVNGPRSIALDNAGNMYIADWGNNRIRKVDLNGTITTVAGNGNSGFSGDGGSALGASLNGPNGVDVDDDGNLFVADSGNNRIRKVFLTTNPKLMLVNAKLNNAGEYSVVISNRYGSVTSQVATLTVQVPPSINSQPTNQSVVVGGTGTFSLSATGTDPLNYCWLRNGMPIAGVNGSSYSMNNLQLSDSGAQFTCIVSNAYGSVTSQVATLTVGVAPAFSQSPVNQNITSGGTARFTVAVSGTGPFTYQWQVNGTNVCPIITTVAGNGTNGYSGDGGAATNAMVCPVGVGVDRVGNLYISDSGNRIRKVSANGIITTVAGDGTSGYSGDGGPADHAKLNGPADIAVDRAGNLVFVDYSNRRIRKVTADGIITTVAGNGTAGYSGDGGPATNAALGMPCVVTCDSTGNLFIADRNNSRVRRVDVDGIITTVAGNGTRGYSGDGGAATNAMFRTPQGVAVDDNGSLFISDVENHRIRKVDTNGNISTITQDTRIGQCLDIAADGAGNLYIGDCVFGRIYRVDINGIITTVVGNGGSGYSGDGGPAASAMLQQIQFFSIDDSGNLFIADSGNYRVRKVSGLSSLTPTLTLPNVGTNNIGNYSVVVASPFGCITSSVVALSLSTVLQPQNFAGSVTQGTNVALQFNGGSPSYPYVLQSATNLVSPIDWEPVVTNVTDDNGLWYFTVTNAAGAPTRFYRVLGQ